VTRPSSPVVGGRWTWAAVAVVLLSLAGCGTPHRLPSVDVAPIPRTSPLRRIELRRPDSFATLDRVVAPEGSTVVVLATERCAGCATLLAPLARAAFGAHPFAVLVLGLPDVPRSIAVAADRLGLTRWRASASAPAAARRLGVDALPAVLLVAGGRIVGRWSIPTTAADRAAIIQEASS